MNQAVVISRCIPVISGLLFLPQDKFETYFSSDIWLIFWEIMRKGKISNKWAIMQWGAIINDRESGKNMRIQHAGFCQNTGDSRFQMENSESLHLRPR